MDEFDIDNILLDKAKAELEKKKAKRKEANRKYQAKIMAKKRAIPGLFCDHCSKRIANNKNKFVTPEDHGHMHKRCYESKMDCAKYQMENVVKSIIDKVTNEIMKIK